MESAVVSRIKYLMGLNNQEKMKIYDKIALKAGGGGPRGELMVVKCLCLLHYSAVRKFLIDFEQLIFMVPYRVTTKDL